MNIREQDKTERTSEGKMIMPAQRTKLTHVIKCLEKKGELNILGKEIEMNRCKGMTADPSG